LIVSKDDIYQSVVSVTHEADLQVTKTMMATAQRVALQLPPRRVAKTDKMHTISRAEGGQLQAPVGRNG